MAGQGDSPSQPPLFDANCMLGTPAVVAPGGMQRGDEVLADLERCGIGRVLAYHALSKDWDPTLGNEALEPYLAPRDRLRVDGSFMLDPATVDDVADADGVVGALLERGFSVVRVCPDPGAHRYSLSNPSLNLLFDACAQRRLPAQVETSAPDWKALAGVLARHPSMPLILTGIAYRHARDLYPMLDAHPSLHIETSTFVAFGALEDVAERFGPGRLLFGTNTPVYSSGAAIARVLRAELPAGAIRAIAGGNLERLLREVER